MGGLRDREGGIVALHGAKAEGVLDNVYVSVYAIIYRGKRSDAGNDSKMGKFLNDS